LHAFFEEEWVALRSLDQPARERGKARVVAEQTQEHFARTLRRERVDAQLRVVRLLTPRVLVLGPVVDQQEHAGGGQALDDRVEERLRLGVHPVEILEDEDQGLDTTFAQQQALARLERLLTALRGIEGLPLVVVHGNVEQSEKGRDQRDQRLIERQQ